MNMAKTEGKLDELMCRTCLMAIPSAKETIYLFNHYLETPEFATLVDFVVNFTSLQIIETDELSPFICVGCYEKLKDILDFRRVCIASNEFLVEQKTSKKELDVVKAEPEENFGTLDPDFYVNVGFPDDVGSNSSDETDEKEIDLADEWAKILENVEPKPKKSTKQRSPSKSKPKSKNGEEENESGTKQELSKIVCEICKKIFFKQHTYDGHMRKHKGLKQFACAECGKDFAKKASLKHHMEANHPQEGDDKDEFICGINDCGKVYSIKQSLKNHIFSVHIQRPQTRQVVCEHCGKSFSSISGLKKHSYIHTGSMPFKCHLCPKTYPTNHKLKVHIMRHEGVKNHVCPTCGLRKTTMHELRVHMNYHTREKQYPCKVCPAVFSNIGNMSRHMRIVHCGVKAFACTHCDRTFGKSDTLKHHIMTHTGEKPHECNVCGKRFIQSIALKTHMKTHNKVRLQR